jgi:hypothetical protein
VVPTLVEGGEFIATYPSRSVLSFDTTYLPRDAGEEGFGSSVRAAVESFVNRYLASDLWVCEHPPRWEWFMDYPPYEADDVRDLLYTLEVAVSLLGIPVAQRGLVA